MWSSIPESFETERDPGQFYPNVKTIKTLTNHFYIMIYQQKILFAQKIFYFGIFRKNSKIYDFGDK